MNKGLFEVFWQRSIEADKNGLYSRCEQFAHEIAEANRTHLHDAYNRLNEFAHFAGSSAAMNSVDVLIRLKRNIARNSFWRDPFGVKLLGFLEQDIKVLAQQMCEEQGVSEFGEQIQARKYLMWRAIDLIALHIRGISIEAHQIR